MDTLIVKLYQSKKTILTNKDLALIWRKTNEKSLHAKTSYYVKQKQLIRLTRGVFAKSKDYNPKELANSLYSPSYISFETVLREAGIIFQHYNSIFIASRWTRVITIDSYNFCFRKIKDIVLFNSTGITNKDNCSVATPERAFLDMIYLFPNYYFDNLKSIDWEACEKIIKIYKNKQLEKRFNKYRKNYAE